MNENQNAPVVKHVFVCLDGTWNGFFTQTNVIKLAEKISRTLPNLPGALYETKVGYFQGIGLGGGILQFLLGGLFAIDFECKVEEAYKYVCSEYEEGKTIKVWIIGFSRGAYSARMLAQRINTCGVVKYNSNDRPQNRSEYFLINGIKIIVWILEKLSENLSFFPFLFIISTLLKNIAFGLSMTCAAETFKKAVKEVSFLHRGTLQKSGFNPAKFLHDAGGFIDLDPASSAMAIKRFTNTRREQFISEECHISSERSVYFLGLFETVGSVGLPPWKSSYGSIQNLYHLFKVINASAGEFVDHEEITVDYDYSADEKFISPTVSHVYQALAAYESLKLFEPLDLPNEIVVENQRYFPGIHIDIGGWIGGNRVAVETANWMIEKINLALGDDQNLSEFPPSTTNIIVHVARAAEALGAIFVWYVLRLLVPDGIPLINLAELEPRPFKRLVEAHPNVPAKKFLYKEGRNWNSLTSQGEYYTVTVDEFNRVFRNNQPAREMSYFNFFIAHKSTVPILSLVICALLLLLFILFLYIMTQH